MTKLLVCVIEGVFLDQFNSGTKLYEKNCCGSLKNIRQATETASFHSKAFFL